jgi:hypothetical protein
VTDENREIEVIESTPLEPEYQTRGYRYEDRTGGLPCCSGCGCLIVALLLLVLFNLGPLLSALIVIIAAAWISALVLRMVGVNRYSAAYVYLLVPVFLTLANLLTKIIRGRYAYDWHEIAVGTLLVYLFLWVMARSARRGPPSRL